MFEKASRLKLRFDTGLVGLCTVEDLWDLPLTSRANRANLDSIAITLHEELQTTNVVSFVNNPAKADEETQLKFDVVKHIIDVKKREADDALLEKQRAERKQKLLSILARKEDNELENLPVDEIRKLVNES